MAADVWADIYPWIVAGLGGFFGAALLLPTKLGDALFNYRLGKALEGFKADQNRELERLKEQLSHVGDRGKRSNEMEFSAIKLVWEKFVEAFLASRKNLRIANLTLVGNAAALVTCLAVFKDFKDKIAIDVVAGPGVLFLRRHDCFICNDSHRLAGL